jgi:GntR family transcriptional regulator
MGIIRYASVSSQIENILLERLNNSIYTTHSGFPSESELCQEFNVSRATIRTAISALTGKGLLIRKPGIGTFINESIKLESGLEYLESVISIAKRQGLIPEVGDVEFSTIVAKNDIRSKLGLFENLAVTKITRKIIVNRTVISLHNDYVPEIIFSADQIKKHFEGSVLDFLNLHHNTSVKEAVTEITSINADLSLSSQLEVELRTAIILLRETLRDQTNRNVSYSENYFVPDRFYLHINRKKI